MARPKILLTHTPDMRENYYGPRALAGLRALGDVVLHDGSAPLDSAGVARLAVGCGIVVSDRNTPGAGDLFAMLPDTRAFLRCAVDIRTIDVAAASRAGILITQASPGFVASVAEMAFGQIIDLARDITRSTVAYRAGLPPQTAQGHPACRRHDRLAGLRRDRAPTSPASRTAIGMTILVNDPYVSDADPYVRLTTFDDVVEKSDFLLPLAVATQETEKHDQRARVPAHEADGVSGQLVSRQPDR